MRDRYPPRGPAQEWPAISPARPEAPPSSEHTLRLSPDAGGQPDGHSRADGLRRLSRLTWRSTQLSAIAAAALGAVGLGLLLLSVAVADQLARSLVRTLGALARASDLLATGNLGARAALAGPPEMRQVSTGLNRLAARIGICWPHERETAADLSHRLRTPLTALRIDAESPHDPRERTQLVSDVDGLQRTVDEIIREARRPSGASTVAGCDASAVIAERAAFWRPLLTTRTGG